MKRTNSKKYSKLSLYRKDNIYRFKKENLGKIKREKTIRENVKEFKLKNNKIHRVEDYYEYEIDGKDLSQHIDDLMGWDSYSFSDVHVGTIGTYGYFWDRIRIMLLLRIKFDKDFFLQEKFAIQYLKALKKEYQNRTIEYILEKSKNPNVTLYEAYGDEFYPVNILIEINKDVSWTLNYGDNKLGWIFKKEEYYNTLNTLQGFFDRKRLKTNG